MRTFDVLRARPATAAAILCLLLSALCVPAWADAVPVVAPRNPEFVRYFEPTVTLGVASQEAHATGLIPAPVDLSHARGKRVPRQGIVTLSLPSSYDLRTITPSRLTPVRNQSSCGSCWAFASYGSMESCLMPSENTDWSENHMKNTHGFDWACCGGGNHYISTAYLARWSGPVTESSDPYQLGCFTSPPGLMPVRHIQNVDFIPDRGGPLDNDNIKQAVMDHGAVYTTLYMTEASPYYNRATAALCYTGGSSANHAVCIVGWDDNYDRSNFLNPPAGNGAFIAKNSWGASWGLNGYFYISYYDTRVGRDNAVFDNADPTTNYDQVYDYDPLGWTSSMGYGSSTAWCANVFTATSSGELRAVSFYTASPGSSYEVYIHLDPDSGPINTSGYAASKTGMIPAMGYHTVELDSPVVLFSGRRFSVVLKLTTPGYNYPIAFEEPYADYSSRATSSPGQSYISSDGASWSDITGLYAGSNVCIKAFTEEASGLLVSPGSGLSMEGPVGGPFSSTSGLYAVGNTSMEAVEWSVYCSEPWVSLSPTGGVLQPGENTTVTVSLNSAANLLGSGNHAAVVSFANLTTGDGSTTRPVNLSIYDGYEVRPARFGWIDPASHTALSLTDDGVSPAQPIPFEFRYYGETYTYFYVSANGMVGFLADGLNAYQNADIPNASLPNAILCPYWDDLNPEAAGSVRVGLEGVAPDRRLVVSWVGVPLYASPSTTLSFQVVLCEGTHDIVFQYLDVRPSSGFGAGRGATVGVENRLGTAGTCYSFNGEVLLGSGTALLFTSRGPEINSIKMLGDGAPVSLRRAVVTSAFADAFYIESDERSSGIRVEMPGHGVARWSRADVTGVLNTNPDGERCISATSVSRSGAGLIAPLGMSGPAIGGGDFHYDPISGAGQQAVRAWRCGLDCDGTVSWTLFDIPGANNVGLLVRTSGRVTWSGADTFYVDDGSMLRDSSGHMGVEVQAPGLLVPPEGAFVCITGVSSCFRADGDVYRRIIVCGQADIELLSQ